MKSDANPMQSAHAAPRCTAHSKRSGFLCKNPAVRGWAVCRMHGAMGGHGQGKANPAFLHGLRTKEWIETRREISSLVRETRRMTKALDSMPLDFRENKCR